MLRQWVCRSMGRGVFVFVLCFLLQVLLAKTREAATPMYPKNAPEDGHKSVTVCKMISMVVVGRGGRSRGRVGAEVLVWVWFCVETWCVRMCTIHANMNFACSARSDVNLC